MALSSEPAYLQPVGSPLPSGSAQPAGQYGTASGIVDLVNSRTNDPYLKAGDQNPLVAEYKQFLAQNPSYAQTAGGGGEGAFLQWVLDKSRNPNDPEHDAASRYAQTYIQPILTQNRPAYKVNDQGKIEQTNWWDRNHQSVYMAAALLGGAFGAAALTGAGAGAAGAGTAGGTTAGTAGAGTAAGTTAGGTAAAGTGAAAAGTAAGTLPSTAIAPAIGTLPAGVASGAVPAALAGAAAGTASGIPWGDIIRTGIQTGVNYGLYQQQRGDIQAATQAQIDAVNRAIDLQQRIYDQTHADVTQARGGLKPYQAIGSAALPNLYRMVGLPMPSSAGGLGGGSTSGNVPGRVYTGGTNGFNEKTGQYNAPSSPVPTAPPSGTSWDLTGAQPAAGAGMVTVQGPDGSQRRVPYDQALYFQSRGGRIIG